MFKLMRSKHFDLRCVNKILNTFSDSSKEASTRQATLTVGVIFIASLSALFYAYTSFPELTE